MAFDAWDTVSWCVSHLCQNQYVNVKESHAQSVGQKSQAIKVMHQHENIPLSVTVCAGIYISVVCIYACVHECVRVPGCIKMCRESFQVLCLNCTDKLVFICLLVKDRHVHSLVEYH